MGDAKELTISSSGMKNNSRERSVQNNYKNGEGKSKQCVSDALRIT